MKNPFKNPARKKRAFKISKKIAIWAWRAGLRSLVQNEIQKELNKRG